MRGRVPHRVKRTTNFIPAGDTSFSGLFCYAHFQSRKFGGTFFVSAIDFCLQDSSELTNSAANGKIVSVNRSQMLAGPVIGGVPAGAPFSYGPSRLLR